MINGRFRLRGGTAAEATAANIILRVRELAVETDTGMFKIGNGTTPWNDLPYGGIQGVGILSIARTNGTGAPGTVDTYTITYTDNTTDTFTLTNGADGLDGDDGRGIVSVARTNGTGAPGTVDTYTVTYTTGPTDTFTITNGANGANGQSVAVQDEGNALTGAATLINFVGQLVTATATGSQVTVTVATPTAAQVGAIPAAEKGAANGVTPLGADSKIPAIYLPGFVDDVLEFANLAAFPTTGESGKLFVAIDTGKTYRWSGSAYIQISASPGSTDAVPEGASNLYFTAQRVRDTVLTALSTATNAAITAADTVLSALGKLQRQITDDIAALAAHINAPDAHPQYLTQAEGDALYQAAGQSAGPTMLSSVHSATQDNTTVTPADLTGQVFTLPPGKTMRVQGNLIFTAAATTTGAFFGFRVAHGAGANGNVQGSWNAQVAITSALAASGLADGDAVNVAAGGTTASGVLGSASVAGNNSAWIMLTLVNRSTNVNATVALQFRSEVAGSAVTAQIGTSAVAVIG